MGFSVEEAPNKINIAAHLHEDTLNNIGTTLTECIKKDDDSRSEWLRRTEKWLELAEQVSESKNFPWPNASNVKFPLLNTAAIQFHARAFPALISRRDLVKTKKMGKPNPIKEARSQRVGDFMSIQLIDLIDSWIDEMDRMLFLLPIVGMAYKKSYFSVADTEIKSDFIDPRDVILNYHATNFERARVTHRIWQSPNEIQEYINAGIYLDYDQDTRSSSNTPFNPVRDKAQGLVEADDDDDLKPREIYESHCWWDLDGDGYKEPYIITIDADLSKVIRIVARWTSESIKKNNGKLIKIIPINFFTQYKFIPDPNSKMYALGFGTLLGPTNEAVNTLLNQLIDAGTLSNTQAGFLSKNIRFQGGDYKLRPGKWMKVTSSMDDLSKGIYPLPVREPSLVLFNLLGLLIDSGKDLSSIQDVLVGKNPGQNQPYATTQAVVEQGLKVFNGIYKRIYRSLTNELKKIYTLNYLHVSNDYYLNVLDDEQANIEKDFEAKSNDVIPGADPDMVAEIEKIQRAYSLAEKAKLGLVLNPTEVTKRILEAEGHEDVDKLMQMPPAPPNPEIELEKLRLAQDAKFKFAELKLNEMRFKEKAFLDRAKAIATLKGIELEEAEKIMQTNNAMMEEQHRQRAELISMMELDLERQENADRDRAPGGEPQSETTEQTSENI